MSKTLSLRRIVTGHDAEGKSCIIIDDVDANARVTGEGNLSATVWRTHEMPCNIAIGAHVKDEGAGHVGTPPPVNGTRLAITEIPPGGVGTMHRTDTLDYVIILAGSIDMDLDKESVRLYTGDVIVQCGTNHRWVNRSDAPARVAFVLMDAVPLGIGTPITRGAAGSSTR
jgi:quercetin dioxygenase-like cupin family protein